MAKYSSRCCSLFFPILAVFFPCLAPSYTSDATEEEVISPRPSSPVRQLAVPMPTNTSNEHREPPTTPSQTTVTKPTRNLAVKLIPSAVPPSSPSQKRVSLKQRSVLIYVNNYCSNFLPRSLPPSPANLFSCVLVRMAATITSQPQAVETVLALCCVSEYRFDAAVAFAKVSRDFIESNPAFARFICNAGKLDTLGLALKRRGQALGYHSHNVLSIMPIRSHVSLVKAPRAFEPVTSACTAVSDSPPTAATKQSSPSPPTAATKQSSPSPCPATLEVTSPKKASISCVSDSDKHNDHELYTKMWNSSLKLILRYEVAMAAGVYYAAFTALGGFVEKLECVLFYALENPDFSSQVMVEYWKVMLHSSLLALDSLGPVKPDVLSLGPNDVEQQLSALTFIKAITVFYEPMNARNESILLRACNFLEEVVAKELAVREGVDCGKSKEGVSAAAHAVMLLEHFIAQNPYLISPQLYAAYSGLQGKVAAFHYGAVKKVQAVTYQEKMVRLGSDGASNSGPSSGNSTPLSNAGAVFSVVTDKDASPVVKHKRTRRAGVKHRMRKKNGGGNTQSSTLQ